MSRIKDEMMLPPVIEIFVVWHPGDSRGEELADVIVEHFRGSSFSGVIGGGAQVSIRSAGWNAETSAPRPCYSVSSPPPNSMRPAEFVAVVPIMGNSMAVAVEDENSDWNQYLAEISRTATENPELYIVLPCGISAQATDGTKLGQLFAHFHRLAAGDTSKVEEDFESMLCRDLTQALAQFLGGSGDRLTVFISHTKHGSDLEGATVDDLIELARFVIANTHLAEFFDERDLQPGENWDNALRANAGKSALLAIRTDLYASREWCQREVVIAKLAGMPLVTIDAIGQGEERGSFLMDHVPRVPVRRSEEVWSKSDLVVALNLLTDECLKRSIWFHQQRLAESSGDYDVAWWAPHAPEPITFLDWVEKNLEWLERTDASQTIRILHPDPPLGPEEKQALQKQAKLSAFGLGIDIMTPRLLAARGG